MALIGLAALGSVSAFVGYFVITALFS